MEQGYHGMFTVWQVLTIIGTVLIGSVTVFSVLLKLIKEGDKDNENKLDRFTIRMDAIEGRTSSLEQKAIDIEAMALRFREDNREILHDNKVSNSEEHKEIFEKLDILGTNIMEQSKLLASLTKNMEVHFAVHEVKDKLKEKK